MNFGLRDQLRDGETDESGGGGGGNDDQGKFSEEQRGEMTTIFNGLLNKFAAGQKKAAVKEKEAQVAAMPGLIAEAMKQFKESADEEGDGTPDGDGSTTEQATALHKLQKQNDLLTKRFDAAEAARIVAEKTTEQTSRKAAIQGLLANYQFATPVAASAVSTLISPQVERDEDGNLVVDGIALEEHVKTLLESPDYAVFLKAEGKGGAGASGGRRSQGAGDFDLNDLKPGATKEQRAAAAADIRKTLLEQKG